MALASGKVPRVVLAWAVLWLASATALGLIPEFTLWARVWLWKAFARARFSAPEFVGIASIHTCWLNTDARAGLSVGDVASWAVLWGASAAALLVVEVEASSALLSVATAVATGWVPVLVLTANLWNQLALAGFVTEVVISSSIGQSWEPRGPRLTVLEYWLDAFALARIAVPDRDLELLSAVVTFTFKVGYARKRLWIASASALDGVPVVLSSTILVVVAHARAGVDIPEVVFGARLG